MQFSTAFLASFTVFALSISSVSATPVINPVDTANVLPTAPVNVPFPIPPFIPESDIDDLPSTIRIFQHTRGPTGKFEGWTGLSLLAKCPTGVNCKKNPPSEDLDSEPLRKRAIRFHRRQYLEEKEGDDDDDEDYRFFKTNVDQDPGEWVITHGDDEESPLPYDEAELYKRSIKISKRQYPEEEEEEHDEDYRFYKSNVDQDPGEWVITHGDGEESPLPYDEAGLYKRSAEPAARNEHPKKPYTPRELARLARFEEYARSGYPHNKEVDVLDIALGGAKVVSMKALEALITHGSYYAPTGTEAEAGDLVRPFNSSPEVGSEFYHPVSPVSLKELLRIGGNALCLDGTPHWDCFI